MLVTLCVAVVVAAVPSEVAAMKLPLVVVISGGNGMGRYPSITGFLLDGDKDGSAVAVVVLASIGLLLLFVSKMVEVMALAVDTTIVFSVSVIGFGWWPNSSLLSLLVSSLLVPISIIAVVVPVVVVASAVVGIMEGGGGGTGADQNLDKLPVLLVRGTTRRGGDGNGLVVVVTVVLVVALMTAAIVALLII